MSDKGSQCNDRTREIRWQESEAFIPGNGREREFSLTSGVVVPKVIKLEEGDESRKINVP